MAQPFDESLTSLLDVGSVIGVCLHREGRLITNHFPRAISQSRVEGFSEAVDEMLSGYRVVGREIEQFVLSFNGGTVLIVAHDNACVSFLLEDMSTTSFLRSTALAFLRDNLDAISAPAPAAKESTDVDEKAWELYHAQLLALMGKVMGSAQVEKVFARVMKSIGASESEVLPKSRFRELGVSLILEIPNRSKQTALRTELDAILADHI